MPDRNTSNILFIHTDSMDGRLMGCMGHPAMANATPTLDALAREGVLFCNAYTNNPICCPSRASTWSGKFTHNCEGWNNFKGLKDSDDVFTDRLQYPSSQLPDGFPGGPRKLRRAGSQQ